MIFRCQGCHRLVTIGKITFIRVDDYHLKLVSGLCFVSSPNKVGTLEIFCQKCQNDGKMDYRFNRDTEELIYQTRIKDNTFLREKFNDIKNAIGDYAMLYQDMCIYLRDKHFL